MYWMNAPPARSMGFLLVHPEAADNLFHSRWALPKKISPITHMHVIHYTNDASNFKIGGKKQKEGKEIIFFSPDI